METIMEEARKSDKKILILCGDYMEDYEVAVPFYCLEALGIVVDCVSPGKVVGDSCLTAVHDFMGYELYTELPGHRFAINNDFSTIDPSSYDGIVIPGGRFTELFSTDPETISLVSKFVQLNKPIVVTCHSQLILAAAGGLGGVKCTGFYSMKPAIDFAGGVWVDPNPFSLCVTDRNVISAVGWPAHEGLIAEVVRAIGGKVNGLTDKSALILCADYVDDYMANIPFRALGAVGCNVDATCPTKKNGEKCVTLIHDFEGSKICSEKRGHDFVMTIDWENVKVENYDCVVIPGGRSPELLMTDEKVLGLVKEFELKNKVIASIDQGHLVLATTRILKGKKCASGTAMKVISKLSGAHLDESEAVVVDGNLVTGASCGDLSKFISSLIKSLGLSVTFN